MRIVVTGGNGKLGRTTIPILREADHRVHSFDRAPPDHHLKARVHCLDLTDTAQLFDLMADIRPDAVIHYAADPAPYGNPRHAQFMGNVGMTHAMMQISGDLGVKHFVNVSSEMANGWSSRHLCPPKLPFGENDVVDSPNHYALGKRVGEMIADSMAVKYPEMGITSLRINLVIMPEYLVSLREGPDRFPWGDANFWAYVDARDAGRAALMAIEHNEKGHQIYMVAATDTILRRPTREAIWERFGSEIVFDPELAEFGSPVDCKKIKKNLGWEPHFAWREELEIAQ